MESYLLQDPALWSICNSTVLLSSCADPQQPPVYSARGHWPHRSNRRLCIPAAGRAAMTMRGAGAARRGQPAVPLRHLATRMYTSTILPVQHRRVRVPASHSLWRAKLLARRDGEGDRERARSCCAGGRRCCRRRRYSIRMTNTFGYIEGLLPNGNAEPRPLDNPYRRGRGAFAEPDRRIRPMWSSTALDLFSYRYDMATYNTRLMAQAQRRHRPGRSTPYGRLRERVPRSISRPESHVRQGRCQ